MVFMWYIVTLIPQQYISTNNKDTCGNDRWIYVYMLNAVVLPFQVRDESMVY